LTAGLRCGLLPEMSEADHLARLVDATRLLAADADMQIGVFPDFVHIPDELALTFDDAFLLCAQLERSGHLNRAQIEALGCIDEALTELTNRRDPSMWTLAAIHESFEWQEIRAKARAALDVMGVTMEPPTLRGITYVPGA
jgi:hypothetical protein